MRQQGGLAQGATCLISAAAAAAAAAAAVLAETYGIHVYVLVVRILQYCSTVQLYMYRECLGIPSQCFFMPKKCPKMTLFAHASQYCSIVYRMTCESANLCSAVPRASLRHLILKFKATSHKHTALRTRGTTGGLLEGHYSCISTGGPPPPSTVGHRRCAADAALRCGCAPARCCKWEVGGATPICRVQRCVRARASAAHVRALVRC
jgi:hypothetical protein